MDASFKYGDLLARKRCKGGVMAKDSKEIFFRIIYRDPDDGQICTLKAKRVSDSSLGLSFVYISDFIFDTRSVLVKPSEEQLQKRLENVRGLHLSIYSIMSIEEMGLEHGGLRFDQDKSNLVVMPTPAPPAT